MWSKTVFRSFKSYTVLKPFLDFEARLSQVESLKDNVRRRKLDVNVDEIVGFYEAWKGLEHVKLELEKSREALRLEMADSEASKDENEVRKLKMRGKLLREDYRQIKSAAADSEQTLAKLMMSVPNELSSTTPDEDEIVHEKLAPTDAKGSHIEIGESLDVLEVKSRWGVFLKGEAALMELDVVRKLTLKLKKLGFVGISNPDFVREIVLDGCEGIFGSSVPLSPFEDDDDAKHLTGGAAAEPFFALFTKTSFRRADLPSRFFTSGRQYGQTTANLGLFHPLQTNAVHVFVVASLPEENREIDVVVSAMTDFYETMDLPFRVVVKGASQLSVAESLRFSFEVFSPHFDKYFEIGHISSYGHHFSKTMNIQVTNNRTTEFPRVISGTVLRFAPLLAAVLETKRTLKGLS